jgi:hypothetical protein
VLGRLQVRDPEVRPGTYDFTGARFMARRDQAREGMAWLEAGWAETGWSERGRQRVYTYDTNHNAWTFYDDYEIHDGDQIWIYLETENTGPRPAWTAWLWWGDEWHLLSSQELPLTGSTQIEEYVEVHSDARQPSGYRVPAITVDNVQLKTAPSGQLSYWRDPVKTSPGGDTGAYCVDWETRYDTWQAGTCP